MMFSFCEKSRIKKGQGGLRFALALFIFAIATSSLSQGAETAETTHGGSHAAGLGVGQVLLMGDFGSKVSNGLGFNLNYSYEASPLLGLFTTFHYSSHSDQGNENSLSIMGLSPDLRVNLAYIDKLVVFTQGGLGLFRLSQKVGSLEGSVMTFEFNLGTGVQLALNEHFAFGTTLSFHNLFSQTATSSPTPNGTSTLEIGGTFIGLFLNVMYIF